MFWKIGVLTLGVLKLGVLTLGVLKIRCFDIRCFVLVLAGTSKHYNLGSDHATFELMCPVNQWIPLKG